MDSNPDKRFLSLFMIVIGSLVAVAIGLVFLANNIGGDIQKEIAEQQKAAAQVEPISAPAPAAKTVESTGKTEEIKPVATAMTGEDVYNQACIACHSAGIAGAPKTGDTASWEARISQGNETLREHVINGYQGSGGYMPPKGGRVDLSDDEIYAAMDYMLEQVR
jgi:cytochrome c5